MSENATPFGACRVYLPSSATAGRSAPWPLASWPHVLTMDIEQGGMVITGTFPLFTSAARAMPPETARHASVVITAMFLLFIGSAALFAGPSPDFDRAIQAEICDFVPKFSRIG